MTRRRSIRPRSRRALTDVRAAATTLASEPQPSRAASLRVELDAEQAPAGDHARRTWRRGSSRRRTSSSLPAAGRPTYEWTKYRSAPSGIPSKASGAHAVRTTWFQPMWGRVGAPSSRTVRPGRRPSVSAPSSSLPSNRSWSPRQIPRNGRSAPDPCADRLDESLGARGGPSPAPPPRRRARRAGRRRPGPAGLGGDVDLRADGRERLADAHQVARAVVDDRDADRIGRRRPADAHPRLPFVEATPVRRGSIVRRLSQRPAEGLEGRLGEVVVVAAGAADVERRAGGPGERLERVLDELERQRPDPLAAERQVDDRVRPAADVDDRRGQRLVHRAPRRRRSGRSRPGRRAPPRTPRRARARRPRPCGARRRPGRRWPGS